MFTHFKEVNKSEESSGKLLKSVKHIEESLNQSAQIFSKKTLFQLFDAYIQFTQEIQKSILNYKTYVTQKSHLSNLEKEQKLFQDFDGMHRKFQNEVLPVIAQKLKTGISEYTKELNLIYEQAPVFIKHFHDHVDLQANPNEDIKIETIKKWKLGLKSIGVQPVTTIQYKDMLRHFIGYIYVNQFHNYLKALIPAFGDITEAINKNIEGDLQKLRRLIRGDHQDHFTEKNIKQRYVNIINQIKISEKYFAEYLIEYHARLRHEIFSIAFRVNSNSTIRQHLRREKPQNISVSLSKFARNWYEHQCVFHNYITATLELIRIRTEYKNIVEHTKDEIDKRFFDDSVKIVAKIRTEIKDIRHHLQENNLRKIKEFLFDKDDIIVFTDNMITTSTLADFQELADTLPKSLRFMDETYYQNYHHHIHKNPHCIDVDLTISTEYLVENKLIAPIDRELQSLPIEFKKINDHIQHGTHLIMKYLNQMSHETLNTDEFHDVLNQVDDELKYTADQLEKIKKNVTNSVTEFLNGTLVCFEPHQFVREITKSTNRTNETHLQGIRKIADYQVKRFEKIKDNARKVVGKTQEDILIADFEAKNKQYENVYALLRTFTNQVTPNAAILNSIPFYYKQLFIGKQLTHTTIMQNRERELKIVQEATLHIKSGKGGAILITGEPFSGKTLFSEKCANDFSNARIFRINPPVGGTTQVSRFIKTFREQTKTRYQETMVDTLPEGSVIIFNDLELWWERNYNTGTAILHHIGRMIDKYSDKYLFILNCNIYLLHFLSQVTRLHENIVATVTLSPFSLEKLQRTILARHLSSGLHFTYGKYHEKNLSAHQADKLFRRILDISEGNIGIALRLWISGIDHIDGEQISISAPYLQEMPLLTNTDKLLLITQIIFHKHIGLEKLFRIYPYGKKEKFKDTIQGLHRSGILSKIGKDTFGINPYVMPYLIKQLKTAKLI